jgi:hypothetical protein
MGPNCGIVLVVVVIDGDDDGDDVPDNNKFLSNTY